MKGEYVVSQKDIMEEPRKDDAIVVSSFPIDSHDCQRVATADGVINEGTIFPVRMPGRKHGYAYHIPYRAILPKAGECDNLLVPVALSCTHVAFSSIRVEPTWMILGQSAGVAAALSARQNIPRAQAAVSRPARAPARTKAGARPPGPARPSAPADSSQAVTGRRAFWRARPPEATQPVPAVGVGVAAVQTQLSVLSSKQMPGKPGLAPSFISLRELPHSLSAGIW